MSIERAAQLGVTAAARMPRAAGPAAAACAAALGCAAVALVDPNRPGIYPTCPFLALTGRWCPGCGMLRAVRALLHGDVALALSLNVLLVLALPFMAYGYLAWTGRQLGRPRLPALRLPLPAIWSLIGLLLVFWIARNIPVAPFSLLAPG